MTLPPLKVRFTVTTYKKKTATNAKKKQIKYIRWMEAWKKKRGKKSHKHTFTTRYHLVSVHFHQVWLILRKIHLSSHTYPHHAGCKCYAKNSFKRVTFIVSKRELVNIWHHKSQNARTHNLPSPLPHRFFFLRSHSLNVLWYTHTHTFIHWKIIIFSSTQEFSFHFEEHQINDTYTQNV